MGKKKNGNAPNKVVKHRNMKKTKTQKRNKDKEEEIRKMLNSQIDLIGKFLSILFRIPLRRNLAKNG